jgi:NADPH:quinone reductase-like Zn-dependent oxidoreductase
LGAEPISYGDGLHDTVAQLERDGLDGIIDLAGNKSIDATIDLLNPAAREAGNVVSITDRNGALRHGGKYIFVRPDAGQLQQLVDLVDTGVLHVEISQTFHLDQLAEAFALSETGHRRGKIVIEIG